MTLISDDDCIFEMDLPASWESKTCDELVRKFASKTGRGDAAALELVRLSDGKVVVGSALLREEIPDGSELAVCRIAPIVLILGEMETSVGLATDSEPRATVPSYVREIYPKTIFESELAAGGSIREKLCKHPTLPVRRYPIGSWCLNYEKVGQKRGETVVDLKGWGDVELVVRNALIEAGLHVHGRHAIVVVPSRATPRFRKELIEMIILQHGAASAAAVPLSACALGWCHKDDDNKTTACVVECGHDSSCALAYVDGVEKEVRWTSRGGRDVTRLFHSLLKASSGRDSISDNDPHSLHVAKKRLCRLPFEDGEDRDGVVGRLCTDDGDDIPVSEEARLAPEILFVGPDQCPFADVAHASPLHHVALDAIRACGTEPRDPLFSNILVVGTDDLKFPGIQHRLARELSILIRHRACVTCILMNPLAKSDQNAGASESAQSRPGIVLWLSLPPSPIRKLLENGLFPGLSWTV